MEEIDDRNNAINDTNDEDLVREEKFNKIDDKPRNSKTEENRRPSENKNINNNQVSEKNVTPIEAKTITDEDDEIQERKDQNKEEDDLVSENTQENIPNNKDNNKIVKKTNELYSSYDHDKDSKDCEK